VPDIQTQVLIQNVLLIGARLHNIEKLTFVAASQFLALSEDSQEKPPEIRRTLEAAAKEPEDKVGDDFRSFVQSDGVCRT
jgi:hypothetical protein